MERRGFIRYPLRLPVCIVAVSGNAVHIPAHTCNISCAGVLLDCPTDLTVGQQVEYVIDLYPDNNLRLLCKGVMERSAKGSLSSPGENGTYTIALSLETFQFVRHAAPPTGS